MRFDASGNPVWPETLAEQVRRAGEVIDYFYRGVPMATDPTRPTHEPAAEGKYGYIWTERKQLHPGEPVFLLRATDPLAPAAVVAYAEDCAAAGCSDEHVVACYDHAERIRRWQTEHPALVKSRPD